MRCVLRHRVVVGAVLLSALGVGLSSCSAFEQSDADEQPQELVGAPPGEDSPYGYKDRPEESARVDESGKLEGSTESPDESERTGTSHRCFSCVRICPADASNCRREQRDVICGWGVHEKEKTARDLARAECNGALERERRNSKWSEITGECPAAECRSPE